jgi:hypothetical protein
MRRVLVYVVVTPLVAVLALLMPATPAAGWQPPGRPLPTLALVLDGMGFGYLPPGLGTTSDFAYHFQHVDFVARVWESQTHAGWTVDLDVDVMRGKRLTTGRALHDWFISYDQRPPAEAHYVPTRLHGRPGWRCEDQVFWLVHPGLAVSVQLNHLGWSRYDLMRMARSARELDDGN